MRLCRFGSQRSPYGGQVLTLASALLIESKRMYGSLSLIGDFGRTGKARSAWRISGIMSALGRQDEADSYAREAIAIREALGHEKKDTLEQTDFDELISGIEQ